MGGSILRVPPSQAAALAVVLVSIPLHAAEPPPRSREVQELIGGAETAAKRLDVDRARELWAQVYGLERSTMALCQLGQLDLRLGRLEDAAMELSTCIEQM